VRRSKNSSVLGHNQIGPHRRNRSVRGQKIDPSADRRLQTGLVAISFTVRYLSRGDLALHLRPDHEQRRPYERSPRPHRDEDVLYPSGDFEGGEHLGKTWRRKLAHRVLLVSPPPLPGDASPTQSSAPGKLAAA